MQDRKNCIGLCLTCKAITNEMLQNICLALKIKERNMLGCLNAVNTAGKEVRLFGENYSSFFVCQMSSH